PTAHRSLGSRVPSPPDAGFWPIADRDSLEAQSFDQDDQHAQSASDAEDERRQSSRADPLRNHAQADRRRQRRLSRPQISVWTARRRSAATFGKFLPHRPRLFLPFESETVDPSN